MDDLTLLGAKAVLLRQRLHREKTAISAFGVGHVLQRATKAMGAGAWKPSAVAVRKGLADPRKRLNAFADRTARWVERPGPVPFFSATRGALPRAADAALAATGPTVPESWLQHMALSLAARNQAEAAARTPFGRVRARLFPPKPFPRTALEAATRWRPARLREDANVALQGAFGHPRPAPARVAPGLDSTAQIDRLPDGELYGTINSGSQLHTLLHEHGHIADFHARPAAMAGALAPTPRAEYTRELMANRRAGLALPRVSALAGAPRVSPRQYHRAARPALETYRLTMLRDAVGQQLRGRPPRPGGSAGPWPRPLQFANPFPGPGGA